jgi:membrane-associated protein
MENSMELIMQFINIFLHLDIYLADVMRDYQTWTYLLLFIVIFCETGLVVTPILPGDSLLFAGGALSALPNSPISHINLFILLALAAVCGDNTNYWIGRWIGPKAFHFKKSRFFNPVYLQRTHAFYEKHGGKTIILARFMPIIRTFAPFVAGVGTMKYPKFLLFSIIGGISWMFTFIFAGYYFGNIPIVKKNFTLVVMAIIIISVMPATIGGYKSWRAGRNID